MNRHLAELRTVIFVGATALLVACGGEDSGSAGDQSQAQTADAQAQTGPHPGEQVYEQFCFSCHTPGLSGAPKLGDAEAWAPRIAKGMDLMLTTTKEGIPPAMPAMGLCSQCSDEELTAAIDYMVVNSQ